MKRSKRPLLQRALLAALIAFLVMVPLGYGFMEYSTRPEFCASCHIMIPYVKSWEDSSHGSHGVGCIDCHFEPGVLETLEGKFKASTQLVKYVTSTEGSKPWAQVSDKSCMRGGCHATRLLDGKVDLDIGRTTIPFNHTPHLLEMRRSKKLRCTSCHSQIVQGQHLTVTASTCLLCHFRGAEEDPKLSACTTCHQPPKKPIDVGGFTFVHDEYVGRGVSCEACHAGVTQGTGEVPKHRCAACHAVQEHIDRYGETEFLHRKHVTEFKVDCLECHTEMTHRVRPQEPISKGECAQCHATGHGVSESFYRGEGGRGVAATPNPMFLTRVGCGSCHQHFGKGPGNGGGAQGAGEVACLACHGTRYEGLLGRWQKAFGPAAAAVEAEVAAAAAAAERSSAPADVRAALADARHDAALVRADGSGGVHNPWFARKLLESAWERAGAAWRSVEPARPASAFPLGPAFPTNLECAKVCHLGVEDRPIRLAGTRFEHERHVGRAGDCDSCHSTAEHGVTTLRPESCASCHHGPKAPPQRDCASCHAEQASFLAGLGADGEDTGTQMMAKVACAECHGDASAPPAPARFQEQCDRCHKAKYEGAVEEWLADAKDWFAEADARLARIRAARKGSPSPGLAAAEAIVERLRRARPAHNMLLFEELKDAFAEAAASAEK